MRRGTKKDEDAFHFIAYIPYKGRLYELDGLQEVRVKEIIYNIFFINTSISTCMDMASSPALAAKSS